MGEPVLDYIESSKGISNEVNTSYQIKDNKITIAVPLNLPYHSQRFDQSIELEDLVLFQGECYRLESKEIIGDEVIVTYSKENLTRESIIALMDQINAHNDDRSNPVSGLDDVLKNFSKTYFKQSISQTFYTWIDYMAAPSFAFNSSLIAYLPLLDTPPPRQA